MNAFIEHPSQHLRIAEIGQTTMFGYDEAAATERTILEALEALPKSGLLVLDFDAMRVASEAARQLLRRALLRIAKGEHEDRFIVLAHLEKCRYSVEAMLRREELTAVERTATGPQLVGKEDRVAADTFEFVATLDEVTAKMVLEHFALQNIGAATNRLASLADQALVRRVGQRSLPGGGREYLFAAVR